MKRANKFRRAMALGSHAVAVMLVTLGVVLVSGCGKSGAEKNAGEGLSPEAVAARKAFASAGPSYRNPVEEALALVRAGQVNPTALTEAPPQLEKLVSNPNISPSQKQALNDLIQKLQAQGVKPAAPKEVR